METVTKRDGSQETIDFEKIQKRLKKLKNDVEIFIGRELNVSVFRIARDTISKVYPGIRTSELDEQAAYISAHIIDDPDYQLFAGNILVSNLEKENQHCLDVLEYAKRAFNFVEERTGEHSPLI